MEYKSLRFPSAPLLSAARRTVQTSRHPLRFASSDLLMIFMRSSSCLFIQMSFHEHLVDVLIRVPFTGLVDGVGTLAQRHGCHAIVLSYHDVSPAAETDQLIIHCICPCSYDHYLAVTGSQYMIGIAQKCHRNLILPCCFSTMSTTGQASASTKICISKFSITFFCNWNYSNFIRRLQVYI